MAEQTDALADVRLQFQDFFGSLSLAKRITILVALGIVLIGMVSMIFVANQPSWAPLYSNMEPGDAAAIVEKLQENQIPYLIAPGGRTIMVEPHKVDQARLILAKEKVTPGGGVGFLDLFSTPSLGETEFQQNVKFRVAQEGELARLISTINVVKSAKVSLAIPKKTLFSDSQEETTAAIALTLTSSGAGRKQIETIVHLVASAVEGLSPRNVKITDQNGTLLSKGFADSSAGGAHGASARATDAVPLRIAIPLSWLVLAQKAELVDQLRAMCRHWSGWIPGEGGRSVLDGGREPLGGDYKGRRWTARSCP